jgi:hypothetical protein
MVRVRSTEQDTLQVPARFVRSRPYRRIRRGHGGIDDTGDRARDLGDRPTTVAT